MVSGIKLVIFDCDGVLADTDSSWEFVHRAFGTDNTSSLVAYLNGEIDDAEFIKRDVRLWLEREGRVHISRIRKILDGVPLIPGAKEAVQRLKKSGVRTAIVSAGIETLTGRVARECGVDMNLSNSLETDHEGFLTGEGVVVVPLRDKGSVVRRILKDLGLERAECAAVGDSSLDGPMFDEVGLRIAFNPADRWVAGRADVVIYKKDLREVLKYIIPKDA
ncbi:MAG: HAD-IB family phosphatase [Thermoplasmata archaeon]